MSSFSGVSFRVDDINVKIHGRVESSYSEDNRKNMSFEEMMDDVGNTVDDMEKLVERFILILKNKYALHFNKLEFFGNIIVVDDDIVCFPLYFILTGKGHCLYKINTDDVTQIELVCENSNYDELIAFLTRKNSEVV